MAFFERRSLLVFATLASLIVAAFPASAQKLLGDVEDSSTEFFKIENTYFVGDHVVSFDPATGTGVLEWKRYTRRPSYSFMKMDKPMQPDRQNEEFPTEYDANPQTPFRLDFVSPRTVRVRT